MSIIQEALKKKTGRSRLQASIIQEALKKVRTETQINKVRTEAQPIREPAPQQIAVPEKNKDEFISSKERIIPNPLLVIALIVALGLAAKQYLWDAKDKNNAPRSVNAAAEPGFSEQAEQNSQAKTKMDAAEAYSAPTLDIARLQVAKSPMLTFGLNGIMQLDGGLKAIINNVVVEEGDVIKGALVAKIDKQSVLLKFNDSEIMLKLK